MPGNDAVVTRKPRRLIPPPEKQSAASAAGKKRLVISPRNPYAPPRPTSPIKHVITTPGKLLSLTPQKSRVGGYYDGDSSARPSSVGGGGDAPLSAVYASPVKHEEAPQFPPLKHVNLHEFAPREEDDERELEARLERLTQRFDERKAVIGMRGDTDGEAAYQSFVAREQYRFTVRDMERDRVHRTTRALIQADMYDLLYEVVAALPEPEPPGPTEEELRLQREAEIERMLAAEAAAREERRIAEVVAERKAAAAREAAIFTTSTVAGIRAEARRRIEAEDARRAEAEEQQLRELEAAYAMLAATGANTAAVAQRKRQKAHDKAVFRRAVPTDCVALGMVLDCAVFDTKETAASIACSNAAHVWALELSGPGLLPALAELEKIGMEDGKDVNNFLMLRCAGAEQAAEQQEQQQWSHPFVPFVAPLESGAAPPPQPY